MRYSFLIFFITTFTFSLQGQDKTVLERGVVSYKATQNIYVKFESTEHIKIGDTLFIYNEDVLMPVLLVIKKSSISCICTPLSSKRISVSDEIFAQKSIEKEPEKISEEKPLDQQGDRPSSMSNQPRYRANKSSFRTTTNTNQPSEKEPIILSNQDEKEEFKQRIRGRVSVASYNNVSDLRGLHRMRYAFLLRGKNLGNTRFSIDNYITFRHTINEWEEVKDNLNRVLKVYSLALRYDFDKTSSLTIGRKINPKISSMGAIDGIQFEKGMGNFILGTIIGSRPDYLDYGINFNLFQYGVYVSHKSNTENKFQQSTAAFIEQRNNSNIDRRFLYLQHSNTLLKNLNLFSSVELSLYENINNEAKNVLSLTNLYVLLRYRFSRALNISASYDTRKNIIYYES
ncbi:MAG: hypothetical protein KAI29_13685 [Cyclobacteriaceae bacterium]|nr:hypothetical protein [Cyclobacteriaceae bacterium]